MEASTALATFKKGQKLTVQNMFISSSETTREVTYMVRGGQAGIQIGHHFFTWSHFFECNILITQE